MNQKLIDKIKKLLALSSSPILAESELALQKAKELMEQYGVSIIESDHEVIVEKEYDYPNGKLNRDFQYNLISIASSLAQMFNCIILIRQDKPFVIGLSTNVEVAFHALDCILNSLWYDYRQLRKQNTSATFSTNFWLGAAEGIRNKFRPKAAEGRSEWGLILYDQLKEYIAKQYPNLGAWNPDTNSTSSRRGYESGVNAGTAAQIRPGLRSESQGRKLLN